MVTKKLLKERGFGYLARTTATTRTSSYCCSFASTKKITSRMAPKVIF